ncbi:hypothetical protein CONCODRAFT_4129, partial [Conidiobolus coronatus NRRL 28638]
VKLCEEEEIIFSIDLTNKKTEEELRLEKSFKEIINLFRDLELCQSLIIPFLFQKLDKIKLREGNKTYLELLKFKVERFLGLVYNLEYLEGNKHLEEFFYDIKCDSGNTQSEAPIITQQQSPSFLNNLVGGLIPQLKTSPINTYQNLQKLPELNLGKVENSQIYLQNLDDYYNLILDSLEQLIDCNDRIEVGFEKLGALSLSSLHSQFRLGNMSKTPFELLKFNQFLEKFSILLDSLNSIQSSELSYPKFKIILTQYKLTILSIKKSILNNQRKIVELNLVIKECHKNQDKILSIMDETEFEPTPELIEAQREDERGNREILKAKEICKNTNSKLLEDLKTFEDLKSRDLKACIRKIAESQLDTNRKKLEKLKDFFSMRQTPEMKPQFNTSPTMMMIDSDTPSFQSYPSSTASIRSYDSLGIGTSSGKSTNLTNGNNLPFYPLDID